MNAEGEFQYYNTFENISTLTEVTDLVAVSNKKLEVA